MAAGLHKMALQRPNMAVRLVQMALQWVQTERGWVNLQGDRPLQLQCRRARIAYRFRASLAAWVIPIGDRGVPLRLTPQRRIPGAVDPGVAVLDRLGLPEHLGGEIGR